MVQGGLSLAGSPEIHFLTCSPRDRSSSGTGTSDFPRAGSCRTMGYYLTASITDISGTLSHGLQESFLKLDICFVWISL